MQLHFSPSMRSITISRSSNPIDLMKIKVAGRRHISCRTFFHTILILSFVFLPFSFQSLQLLLPLKVSTIVHHLERLVREFRKIIDGVKNEEIPDGLKIPNSFSQLVLDMSTYHYDARTFAFLLRGMMEKFEKDIRESKFAELLNKHFAASAIPRGLHCLSLRLTDEYSSNAHARKQLPSPELLPILSNESYHHFVLSTDNILAASVVVNSAISSSSNPKNIVFHVITDKKTYAGMRSWFALNSVSPTILEVKGLKQFDWLTRENVPVLEAAESHYGIRNYYHGNHMAGANQSDVTPHVFASKLQSRSPKYISLLNHIRIYLPEVPSCSQISTR